MGQGRETPSPNIGGGSHQADLWEPCEVNTSFAIIIISCIINSILVFDVFFDTL